MTKLDIPYKVIDIRLLEHPLPIERLVTLRQQVHGAHPGARVRLFGTTLIVEVPE